MPEMSGLDMLEKLYSEEEENIREYICSNLSGYTNFDYAKSNFHEWKSS